MVAANAVGLEDHRRMLRDHARRLREGHVIASKSLGVEGLEMPAGDDTMGDIIITGDIYGGDSAVTALRNGSSDKPTAVAVNTPMPAAPPAVAAKPASTWGDKLKTAALIGAMGLGAAALLRPTVQPPQTPAMVDTDTDTATDIRFAPEK